MYLELHSFYYTEVHVGKNLEEQYEEYKGTKNIYWSVYYEICLFQLESSYIFSENSRIIKI